jgi:dienelactone hydrolase
MINFIRSLFSWPAPIMLHYRSFEMPSNGTAAAAWYPSSGGPYPVIIVSHGYSGGRHSSFTVCEKLADKGFVVVALDHSDEVKSQAQGSIDEALADLTKRPPSLDTHGYRIQEVIDAMNDLPRLSWLPADPERIAAVGHSMGGWTMIHAALRDVRIKALVSWSMGELHMLYTGQHLVDAEDLAKLTGPSLWLYGQAEEEAVLKARGRHVNAWYAFSAVKGPRSLRGIPGGNHFVYIDPIGKLGGGSPTQLKIIADETADWLSSVLK